MTFKKPEKSYLSYKIDFDKKLQEEKILLEKKETELLAEKFIINFKKILQLVSYTENNFIPLDSIYSWRELAIEKYGRSTGTKLIEKIQEKDPCIDNITFCNLNDPKEVEDFNNSRGCCGRANFTAYINGIQFKFGYNYGH